MPENKSPWGSGGKSGGGKKPESPFGSGGRKPGQRPPPRGGSSNDLENVIQGFKDRFGGGSGGGGKRGGPNSKLTKFGPFGLVVLGGLFVMALSSIYMLDQNEEGVVLRFGEYSRTTGPGLHFKMPTPFETVEKVDIATNRTILIDGGSSENLMLTGDENIVRIDYAVLWRPNNSADYLFNLNDVPGAVRDVAESAMREVVGRTDLDPLITSERGDVALDAQKLMQVMLDEYKSGALVIKVELKESQEPKAVAEAFRDVVEAKQDAAAEILRARAVENTLIPQANADADKLIQEARGYKEAVIAESKGDADRFKSIVEEYKLAPKVTRQRMYLETLEKVYQEADKIVMDDQAGSGVVPYLPLDQLIKKKPGAN